MNAINYSKETEKILSAIGRSDYKNGNDNRPRLMMHSCCAPCSSYCLIYLKDYFKITTLFYNPNIYPFEEYRKRELELRRLVGCLNEEYYAGINCIDSESVIEGLLPASGDGVPISYRPEEFFDMARGMENIAEGGERCHKCYELRLSKTAELAAKLKYDYFVTTLSISPLKNATKLNEIGLALGQRLGIKYLPSDFKKKDGYKMSIELSKKYGLYRQNYCGCVYSKPWE